MKRIKFSRLWKDVTKSSNLPIPDLIIICKDDTLYCHQSIVAGASGFLRTMLQNISLKNGDDGFRINEDATIFLPDEDSEVIKKCLRLLYDGVFAVGKSPEDRRITKEVKNTWMNVLYCDILKMNNKESFEVKQLEKKISERNFGFGEEDYSEEESMKTDNYEDYDTTDIIDYTLHEDVPINPIDCNMDDVRKDQSPTSCSKRKLSSLDEDLISALKQATDLTNKKPKESRSSNDCIESNDVLENDGLFPEETIRSIFDIKTLKSRKVPENDNIAYSVERIHVCVICNGRTKEGKPDREASSLSFTDLKKLKQHYSKHFYAEGKIVQYYPLENKNKNEDGSIKDEFGKQFRYECTFETSINTGEPCWRKKQKKKKCGYKEIALHVADEHGLFETIVAKDNRPEIMDGLILKLQEYRNEM